MSTKSTLVVNTRNRPKHASVFVAGPLSALALLTDVCHQLEGIPEKQPALLSNRLLLAQIDHAVRGIYLACSSLEQATFEPTPDPRGQKHFQPPQLVSYSPGAADGFITVAGAVDAAKLYQVAKQIGPWECGDAVCAQCPFGGKSGAEVQRKECVSFYRAEALQRVIFDELLAGLPYTREQLGSFSRRDLSALVGLLRINKFKLKDRSTSGLITAIVLHQEALAAQLGDETRGVAQHA